MPRIRTVNWRGLEPFGDYEWSQTHDRERPHWIYFLQGDDGGPIKIGRCINLKYRLSGLVGGYPFGALDYCGVIRGVRTDEFAMHRRFAALHMRCEWFRAESPLTDFILSLPEPG